MLRRPKEDNGEKRDAREGYFARGRGIADDRRQGSGGASDHDILRGKALEPHRVDGDVEKDGEAEKRGGEPIGADAQGEHRKDGKDQAKTERVAFIHPTRRDRAILRPPHQRVNIGVIPHVEDARRARPGRDGEQRGESNHRVDMRRRDQNPGERGEDHQRHDARFEQRQIIGRARGRMGMFFMMVRYRRGQYGSPRTRLAMAALRWPRHWLRNGLARGLSGAFLPRSRATPHSFPRSRHEKQSANWYRPCRKAWNIAIIDALALRLEPGFVHPAGNSVDAVTSTRTIFPTGTTASLSTESWRVAPGFS